MSPLYLACFTANLPVVELLLKHHANVAMAENKGESILHLCGQRNLHKIALAIVQYLGAKIEYDGIEYISTKAVTAGKDEGLLDLMKQPI